MKTEAPPLWSWHPVAIQGLTKKRKAHHRPGRSKRYCSGRGHPCRNEKQSRRHRDLRGRVLGVVGKGESPLPMALANAYKGVQTLSSRMPIIEGISDIKASNGLGRRSLSLGQMLFFQQSGQGLESLVYYSRGQTMKFPATNHHDNRFRVLGRFGHHDRCLVLPEWACSGKIEEGQTGS